VLRLARVPLLWLMVTYYVISALTLAVWDSRGVYSPTGDEVHYLVIADALISDSATDVTEAYRREIDKPRWYPPGLAEPGAPLEPPNVHVVSTGDGLHSWHGLAVGALVAGPAQVFGEMGARWVMVIVASGAVVLAWALAGRFLPSARTRVGATAAVAIAYPLLLAGTQVYPDIPGGILLLGVLTWWVMPRARASTGWTLAAGLAAAVVPWLGSRFILPGVIAVLAMGWALRWDRRLLGTAWAPALISALALLAYHLTAFGNPLGPPTEGNLVFGREFWLLLPGLLFDQNQGLFWANPVLWVALPGLVFLWRHSQAVVVLWGVLVLSLWIPAAAHPGLYGLGSFNGRYAWPLALLAVLPALVALGELARRAPRWFWVITGLGVVFQAYLVGLSVVIGGSSPGSPAGLDLYTRPPGTWLESYSAWWFPLQRLLPAWYDPDWAFTYPQNWVWLVIAALLVISVCFSLPRIAIVSGAGVSAVAVAIAAVAGEPGTRSVTERFDVVAVAGSDPIGYPAIGPVHLMRFGTYVWSVDYSADGGDVIGKWELVRVADDAIVASGELAGTAGADRLEDIPITVRSLEPREYALRVGWYGEVDLEVRTTGVRLD